MSFCVRMLYSSPAGGAQDPPHHCPDPAVPQGPGQVQSFCFGARLYGSFQSHLEHNMTTCPDSEVFIVALDDFSTQLRTS